MEDSRVAKLREKLGISIEDHRQAAGKEISPNLRTKISGFAGAGGNFVSAPTRVGGNFVSAPTRVGGNFVSAPTRVGGNFVSAPTVGDHTAAGS